MVDAPKRARRPHGAGRQEAGKEGRVPFAKENGVVIARKGVSHDALTGWERLEDGSGERVLQTGAETLSRIGVPRPATRNNTPLHPRI